MRSLKISIASVSVPLLLAGCSAMTSLSASDPKATVAVATSTLSATPRTESFKTTSFGNYEFKAEAPGQEPFYGILPLKFNGGYLTMDILLFAPAMFFNLREVYAYYDFDIPKKQVRYKQTLSEDWNIFVPLEADAEQGKAAFGGKP